MLPQSTLGWTTRAKVRVHIDGYCWRNGDDDGKFKWRVPGLDLPPCQMALKSEVARIEYPWVIDQRRKRLVPVSDATEERIFQGYDYNIAIEFANILCKDPYENALRFISKYGPSDERHMLSQLIKMDELFREVLYIRGLIEENISCDLGQMTQLFSIANSITGKKTLFEVINNRLVIVFETPSLIDFIIFQLVELLGSGARITVCGTCKAFLIAERNTRSYCNSTCRSVAHRGSKR